MHAAIAWACPYGSLRHFWASPAPVLDPAAAAGVASAAVAAAVIVAAESDAPAAQYAAAAVAAVAAAAAARAADSQTGLACDAAGGWMEDIHRASVGTAAGGWMIPAEAFGGPVKLVDETWESVAAAGVRCSTAPGCVP